MESRGVQAQWDPPSERHEFGLLGMTGHPKQQQGHGSSSVPINPLLHQHGNLYPGGDMQSCSVMRGYVMVLWATGSFAADTTNPDLTSWFSACIIWL